VFNIAAGYQTSRCNTATGCFQARCGVLLIGELLSIERRRGDSVIGRYTSWQGIASSPKEEKISGAALQSIKRQL
jgi:hypothetical protein